MNSRDRVSMVLNHHQPDAVPLGVSNSGVMGMQVSSVYQLCQTQDFDDPGTPALVPEGFNTNPEPHGDILMYTESDQSAPPSGRMPKGGFHFDAIVRQQSFADDEPTEDLILMPSSGSQPLPLYGAGSPALPESSL